MYVKRISIVFENNVHVMLCSKCYNLRDLFLSSAFDMYGYN